MCLMLDQFLWGHSSRVCDISCSSLFLVDEGREYPNTTISEPSLAHQRNADDGPTLNAGLKAL